MKEFSCEGCPHKAHSCSLGECNYPVKDKDTKNK